ncbi:MAG: DUF1127 domain-containing protein [Alphaproteobacteria bacterium]|nr:DUF1127 domain-containing protein [Alphaproteobacteria bacterium]MDP6564908.1 DUF1127 domain-containing protein [Alphaproteobacteria bacterium]MDP6815353.1 DUF1127 domain-containing protein [Alphaproteobacteria bacterium]
MTISNYAGAIFGRYRGFAEPAQWLRLLLAWQERAQQRHRLADLDDRTLQDLGLSRADVANECRKPFWRA